MCAVRRTTSTRLTRLAAKASPYHSAVMLYEANDAPDSGEAQAGPSAPRRSRHVKRESTEPEASELDTWSDRNKTAQKPTSWRKSVKPDSDASVKKKPKSKPTSKPKRIPQGLAIPHPAPEKWADVYDAIKTMRSRAIAPVDTMGCHLAQVGEREPKVG